MQKFEQGTQLLRTCYSMLSNAEQRIELLTRLDDNGNPVTEPFDATATIERANRPRANAANSETSITDNEDEASQTLF